MDVEIKRYRSFLLVELRMEMAINTQTPQVKWAQRPKLLLITICLEDCKSPSIEILSNRLMFHGKGGTDKKTYKLELNFFKTIIPEKSRFAVRERGVDFVIEKLDAGPYWERLVSESTKLPWIKVNFDKWVDEEELNESQNKNLAPNFDDMSWNTLMETLKRNSPDGENPVEKLALNNEHMKNLFLQHQEKLQKQKS